MIGYVEVEIIRWSCLQLTDSKVKILILAVQWLWISKISQIWKNFCCYVKKIKLSPVFIDTFRREEVNQFLSLLRMKVFLSIKKLLNYQKNIIFNHIVLVVVSSHSQKASIHSQMNVLLVLIWLLLTKREMCSHALISKNLLEAYKMIHYKIFFLIQKY